MRLNFSAIIAHKDGQTILNPGTNIKDWIKLLSGTDDAYQVAKMTYGVAVYHLVGLNWKYLLSIKPNDCDATLMAHRRKEIHQLFDKMILV